MVRNTFDHGLGSGGSLALCWLTLKEMSKLTTMRHTDCQRRFVRWSGIQLATAGLLAIAFPSAPSSAAQKSDYETCAARLLQVGLAPEVVAPACADVLRPRDLSTCVVRISQQASAPAADALSACRRVRRPVELATCVVDINRSSKDPTLPEILDNCRRSLLPTDFSNCVVGLSRRIDLASTQAMSTCISTADRPRDFAPTFIPQDAVPTPRLTPLTAPEVDTPVLP